MDGLTSKTIAWEKEKGVEFTYDGVSALSKKLVHYGFLDIYCGVWGVN